MPPPGEVRSIAQLLRACTSSKDDRTGAELAALIDGIHPAHVLAMADHHRVTNQVYLRLRDVEGVDPILQDRLRTAHVEAAARHLCALDALTRFHRVLGDLSVAWMTFKGPVLSELTYPEGAPRTYRDVDILVPAADFERVIAALERQDFELLDRNWELLARQRRGQLHVQLPLGLVADVHWHPLNHVKVRHSLSLSANELFERARRVPLGPVSVATLEPTDNVLFLCLHAALSGGSRLGWLADIERCIHRQAEAPDWEELLRRAHAWKASRAVATILARSRRAVGADVPDGVIPALDPSPVARTVSSIIDGLWPVERAHRLHGVASEWTRLRRDSFESSCLVARAKLGTLSRRLTGSARRRTPFLVARTDSNGGRYWRSLYFASILPSGPEHSGAHGDELERQGHRRPTT